jgi:hypothetical protein
MARSLLIVCRSTYPATSALKGTSPSLNSECAKEGRQTFTNCQDAIKVAAKNSARDVSCEYNYLYPCESSRWTPNRALIPFWITLNSRAGGGRRPGIRISKPANTMFAVWRSRAYSSTDQAPYREARVGKAERSQTLPHGLRIP